MKFLKAINIQSLLLLALAQLIFRYGFLEQQQDVFLALKDWQHALLVLACVCIAAAGYAIHDVNSNNPKLSESAGYNLYTALTLAGVGIGFYLSNHIEKPWFTTLFILAGFGMYLNATQFRTTLLVSNFVMAIMVALGLLFPGAYNLYPVIPTHNIMNMQMVFSLVIDHAVFLFVTAFMLTLANDLKNTDADYNAGNKSLPIALGKERTAKIAFFIGLIPVGMVLYYANAYLKDLLWALGYMLLFLLGPLIYFLINIWTAKSQKEYARLETVLKFVLFFAVLSLAVVTLNIQNNA